MRVNRLKCGGVDCAGFRYIRTAVSACIELSILPISINSVNSINIIKKTIMSSMASIQTTTW